MTPKLTTSIVIGGVWIEVVGFFVGAPFDFIAVADAISVGVCEAVAVAVESGLSKGAGPIVVCCIGAVVACCCIGAPFDFIFVADAVSVGVREAVSVAVLVLIGEHT